MRNLLIFLGSVWYSGQKQQCNHVLLLMAINLYLGVQFLQSCFSALILSLRGIYEALLVLGFQTKYISNCYNQAILLLVFMNFYWEVSFNFNNSSYAVVHYL